MESGRPQNKKKLEGEKFIFYYQAYMYAYTYAQHRAACSRKTQELYPQKLKVSPLYHVRAITFFDPFF